jgi:hypothetical protein
MIGAQSQCPLLPELAWPAQAEERRRRFLWKLRKQGRASEKVGQQRVQAPDTRQVGPEFGGSPHDFNNRVRQRKLSVREAGGESTAA